MELDDIVLILAAIAFLVTGGFLLTRSGDMGWSAMIFAVGFGLGASLSGVVLNASK